MRFLLVLLLALSTPAVSRAQDSLRVANPDGPIGGVWPDPSFSRAMSDNMKISGGKASNVVGLALGMVASRRVTLSVGFTRSNTSVTQQRFFGSGDYVSSYEYAAIHAVTMFNVGARIYLRR
jgi:hypothetical protein